MTKPIIDPSLLCKLLRYDPDSGKLFWLSRPEHMFSKRRTFLQFNTCFANTEAFTAIDGRGYRSGRIWDKTYHGHRVAWAVWSGEWPDVIDHINGDRSDNRIINMRNVTKAENARRKAKTQNTPGVGFCQRRNLWRARVMIDYKEKHLGYFKTQNEAIAAREKANTLFGFTYYGEKNDRT
jgi:hypothetical protein